MATLTTTIQYSEPAGTIVTSLGVPGPAGPGVPVGGAAGQILAKIDGTDYNTEWVNPEDNAAIWGQITGDLANQLDLSSALSLKLDASTAASTYQTLSGMADYLSKAGNLAGIADPGAARANLGVGEQNDPTFVAVYTSQAPFSSALEPNTIYLNGPDGGNYLDLTNGLVLEVSGTGIRFPDASIQLTAFNTSVLAPYALIDSQVFTGTPSLPTGTIAVTQATGTSTTQIATTAFTQQELAAGTAVAKALEIEARNQTGSTLVAGTIVYINGATGNKPTIAKALATSDATSAQTIGLVKTDIANNGTGKVIVRGILENIDTSSLAEGVQLYLSGTTAGTWTTTKPVAPIHLVYIGIVTRSHPTLGTIEVVIQNGPELSELHDVLIASPSAGQILTYDATTSLWKNQTPSAGSVAWGSITGTITSQLDLQDSLALKANLDFATFTGKVNFTPVDGVAGLNIGVGGTSAASVTPGDLYINTGTPSLLRYRDANSVLQTVPIIGGTNTFTAPQIINVQSSTLPALRVTQIGQGLAIRVEDATTPDTTAFYVANNGRVGIGWDPDTGSSYDLHIGNTAGVGPGYAYAGQVAVEYGLKFAPSAAPIDFNITEYDPVNLFIKVNINGTDYIMNLTPYIP